MKFKNWLKTKSVRVAVKNVAEVIGGATVGILVLLFGPPLFTQKIAAILAEKYHIARPDIELLGMIILIVIVSIIATICMIFHLFIFKKPAKHKSLQKV